MRRGSDTSRFLKSMLAELLFGNDNIGVGAMIRNDNASVVEHVHSINSVMRGRRLNVFPGSNREESETNPLLVLSHIMGPMGISDEMTKLRAGII